MTNSDRLYTAMRDFTNTRRENREIYLRKKRQLESYKGSEGYQKDLDAAMKIRKDADEAARIACKKVVDEALAAMDKVNSSRGVTPPSDEMIRILTVARMIKKPSMKTLDAIANSLEGNALALAALTDIGREAWKDDPAVIHHIEFAHNYGTMAAKGYDAEKVHNAIVHLGKACGEIMRGSGAKRAAELAASAHARQFGGKYDPDDLKQEEPYMTEREFYDRTIGVDYDAFTKAVN